MMGKNKIRNALSSLFFKLHLWALNYTEDEFIHNIDFHVLYRYLPAEEAKRLLEKEYGKGE